MEVFFLNIFQSSSFKNIFVFLINNEITNKKYNYSYVEMLSIFQVFYYAREKIIFTWNPTAFYFYSNKSQFYAENVYHTWKKRRNSKEYEQKFSDIYLSFSKAIDYYAIIMLI